MSGNYACKIVEGDRSDRLLACSCASFGNCLGDFVRAGQLRFCVGSKRQARILFSAPIHRKTGGMRCKRACRDWAKATEPSNACFENDMIFDKPPEQCKRCPPNFSVTEVFDRYPERDFWCVDQLRGLGSFSEHPKSRVWPRVSTHTLALRGLGFRVLRTRD